MPVAVEKTKIKARNAPLPNEYHLRAQAQLKQKFGGDKIGRVTIKLKPRVKFNLFSS
jgi:hypothetical protein